MLGLGISKSAQGVKSGIVKLLNSLKRRAEYFENKKDSKSEIKVLKNYELLDKATILLTPTATSNALVHSVKTNVSGEFVTDNDFPNFDNWTEGTGWTTSNGKAVHTQSVGGGDVYQELNLQVGRKYLFKAKIDATSDSTMGNTAMQIRNNANTSSVADLRSGDSEILPNIVNDLQIVFTATEVNNLVRFYSIDEISVYDVSITDISSDFDFDRASSATRINSSGLVQDMQSITDPELVLNGDFEELGDELVTNGSFDTDSNWTKGTGWSINGGVASYDGSGGTSSIVQSAFTSPPLIIESGKTYKINLDVLSNEGSGNNTIYLGGVIANTAHLETGSYTFYVTTSTTGGLSIFGRSGENFSIDNVSVKQVNVDSQGNDIWTLGTGWSIEDGVAKFNDTIASTDAVLRQDNLTLTNGNTYELSFNVSNTSGTGEIKFQATGGGADSIEGYEVYSGVNTLYFTPTANRTTLKIFGRDTYGSFTIDNVSVKDITFSTDVDLARINYDSNGENGHILLEPTSTNLVGYSLPNDTNWSKGSNTTITENYAESPDGTQNASRLVMPTGSGTYAYYQFTATSTTDHTLSFYAKNNGGDADVTMAFFVASQTQNITLTNEWQRFEFTTSITSGNAVQVGVDNITSVDMLIYGVQCEALSYATSYIPTLTGSTVTRAAETLNGSGNSTLINTTQGTIYLESKLGGTTGTKLFSIGGGTNNANPAVTIGYTGQNMYIDIIDSGSLISTGGDRTISGINVSSYNKMAIKYTTTNVTVYLNGVQKHTETIDFTPDTNVLKTLYAGYGTGSKFEGEVKTVAVFNEALSNTDLENLTS